ncbi:SGNH/GDSL hydrolase family protein [Nitrosovibrio sp. Nv6]|uniref:SGNH/GDSL hydrolase family protein n=1 Tax=Nitrosovibrio sp. Nv6 TaxID=1855340 RepID=UPI0008B87998|nr:SGNH/GDSL hydrolase family protein [Nitrosovibrio sp. Nv6]SEO39626.1 PEP-CTERM protein-sorting domain-containing protein [Nitrosovibrio sp. Nv6]
MNARVTFVALFALLSAGSNVWAATAFTGLHAFGDSLLDAGDSPSAVTSIYKILGGNCDVSHPCPPYEGGRLSNGPVASEYMAESLFPGGVTSTNFRSYAVGGATSGIGNSGDEGSATESGIFNLPGMKQQLEHYMSAEESGGVADPNALYLVWGGGGDYLTHNSPVAAAQNIGGYVNTLATAGARHILVPNLVDLGHTPLARSEGEELEARAYSLVFNTELATQLGSASSNFPTTDIYQFDTYSFQNDIIQNPVNYGFTDVQDPCVSLLVFSCDNPDGHLYWDSVHPTTRAHALLASAFISAVPEPQVTAMFIAGLFILGFAAYRQRNLGADA